MRIDAGQHMRMEQRMKLSPRMIQSMEILQLASMALEERIEQELEANPTLELVEESADRNKLEQDDGYDPEAPMVVADTEQDNASDDFERLSDMSEQYGDTWEQNTEGSADYHTPMRKAPSGERDAKMDAMANTACRSASLVDQMLDQWRYVDIDDRTRAIGEHMIAFIDDDGYLRTELREMLDKASYDVTEDDLRRVLKEVQTRLDPPGIAARDLQECMLIQLDALIRDCEDDEELPVLRNARTLVADHLKDIEMNRMPRITRQSGMSMDDLNDAMLKLRRLDPRPGRNLSPERVEVIMPDVLVEYDPMGDRYIAAMNRGTQPDLRISPQYRKLSKDRDQDRKTRKYIADNLNHARWLIDALQQRETTLLRVVNIVIEAQRDFLDHGPEHLKPLPMIGVADQLGIHVGTVSRAVAEKYMQTPRGIYPLRMFFSGGTESSDGQEMSWAAVQAKLKAIIDDEDTKDPWSDDKLVDELKKQGIDIARRTVAKYRQQLNIPPARRRKQF
ncbi:MAG: RNA polymerase factor sigma-54 [Phycisphaera sp.]|nr:RNA polymerase factor sigma-54 [Phycisphaera sp.]